MTTPKISVEPLPVVFSPELIVLRDSMQRNLEKLQDFVNTRTVPTGTMAICPTAATPDGWLVCNGSSFDGVKYRELQDFLGGTTLPDLRGRTIYGLDAGQAEFDSIGEMGGSKTGAGTHTHIQNGHGHVHDHGGAVGTLDANTGGLIGGHGHNLSNGAVGTNTAGHLHDSTEGQFASRPNGANFFTGLSGGSTDGQNAGHVHEMDHGHGIAENGQTATAINQDGGTASGNLPPYKVANWMIKT